MKLRYSVRFRTDDIKLIKFAQAQDNFNDTVRYLIEKEIAENGIRNLQGIVPAVRDENYFSKILKIEAKEIKEENIDSIEKNMSVKDDEMKNTGEIQEKNLSNEKSMFDIPSCYE